jgi:3'-phosphoadenosine 5'-phosphosulfate sulfotransferase (PAPS reductase)/FAD synthetase
MANKHLPHDLKQMQSLPLEAKIIMTQQRIRQWYEYWEGNVYVSFSGGKDSTVLKHIVDGMYKDVPAVFVNTGLEYPEIQRFAREIKAGKYDCFNSDVEIVRPDMRFDEVIKKYGYPVVSKSVSRAVHYARLNISEGKTDTIYTRQFEGTAIDKQGRLSLYNKKNWVFLLTSPFNIHNSCCDVMKKKPFKVYEKRTRRKPYIGTLASESMNRKTQWEKNGCNYFNDKKGRSAPLSFWTEQDILHYIKKYNVPYCPVYGEIVVDDNAEIEGQINFIDVIGDYEETDRLKTTGCDRTGCIFCMFGCHLEKSPNRFQRLKETHPKQYEYCINGGEYNEEGKWQPNKEGLGLAKVLDYIGVDYE